MRRNIMKTVVLSVFPMLSTLGCANRNVYHTASSDVSTLTVVVSIILAIEVLITIVVQAHKFPGLSAGYVVTYAGSLFGGFIFGYIIFA